MSMKSSRIIDTRKTTFIITMIIVAFACLSTFSIAEEETYTPKHPNGKYLIQPYDILTITVWPYEELTLEATVRPDGMISYPMVGEMEVAGSTAGEVGEVITDALSVYVKAPKVSVNVRNIRMQRAFVLGEVQKPGLYEIRPGDNVMDLISKAGGPTRMAKKSEVGIIRPPENIDELREKQGELSDKDREVLEGDYVVVNLATMLGKGHFPPEYDVNDGDIVFVPRGGKQDWSKTSTIVNTIYNLFRIDDIYHND